MNVTEVAPGASLVSASAPVQVDWDFHSGALEVVAGGETEIRLGVADGLSVLRVAAGRHRVSGVVPDAGTP